MLNYSMLPGGAMMICESIAEYDPNVELVIPEEEQTPAVVDAAATTCPVGKVINKMREVYDPYVKEMLTMDFTAANAEEAVLKLKRIYTCMEKVVNKMRCIILKSANPMLMDIEYTNTPFINHKGIIMKNKTNIIRNGGYTEYEFRFQRNALFMDHVMIDTLIRCGMDKDLLEGAPFSSDTISTACKYCNFGDQFESVYDMLNTIFENPDRLLRLENSYLDDPLRLEYLIDSECRPTRLNDSDCTVQCLIKMLSINFRDIAKRTYNLTCDIIDGGYYQNLFVRECSRMCSTIVNIFAICVAYAMMCAYHAKYLAARYKAVEEYTEHLLEFSRK